MNKIFVILKAAASTIEKIILFCWAGWFTLINLTNFADGLKAMGVFSQDLKFVSGNFDAIVKTTAKYGVSMTLNALLFTGVLIIETAGTIYFWKAFKNPENKNLYPAFAIGLILFMLFIFADEIFIAYALEGTHMRIFVALLVSLITILFLRKPKEN